MIKSFANEQCLLDSFFAMFGDLEIATIFSVCRYIERSNVTVEMFKNTLNPSDSLSYLQEFVDTFVSGDPLDHEDTHEETTATINEFVL